MPNSPEATLAEIQQKIRYLAESRDNEYRLRLEAQKEADDLRADLVECRKQLDLARRDAQYLALSHHLADNPDAVAKARHIIGNLISKVDSAIRLVKNDPV